MIPFTKAHACGNDFLIVEAERAGHLPLPELTRKLCSRNEGIGADGIEFFTWRPGNSGKIHLYNADGSTAEISGNGTRCVAAWVASERGAAAGDEILLETDAGLRRCQIVSQNGRRFEIASWMGVPEVSEREITSADGKTISGAVVSMGNPHFVIRVGSSDFSIGDRDWRSLGEELSRHPEFPRQTNVEFVQLANPSEVSIRIYERGVGPTTSSGTGTCASASAAIHLWGAKQNLAVTAEGGTQTVVWPDRGSEMLLTGPAELICRGEAY